MQGIVLLRKGENALEVLERVRAKVEEINQHDLPAGVQLVPHYDRTELIDRTLHTVRQNMIEGIGLVLLVLILFLGLGNCRSALVVGGGRAAVAARARSCCSICAAFRPT